MHLGIWVYRIAWEGNIYQNDPADPGTVQSGKEIHSRGLRQMALGGTFTNRPVFLHNADLPQ